MLNYITQLDDREFYVGTDNLGVELKLIIVPDDRHADRLACIHAMLAHYRKGL